MEGEGANVSTAYHNWEFSLWTQEGNKKHVVAFDSDHFKPGQKLDLGTDGLSVLVKTYHSNCDAFGVAPEHEGTLLNGSGIGALQPKPYDKELENNSPGGVFQLQGGDGGDVDILLYGGEKEPLVIDNGKNTYYVKLRRRRSPLPFMLKLKDFQMEYHPNTEMARSYKSQVEVITHGVSREALISMNEPLRYKKFTLYQSSYFIDRFKREHSTLAVVKNSGRLLPYIATFVTFAGLAIHLLLMAFQSKTKVTRKKK
jgi:hypothetical protein